MASNAAPSVESTVYSAATSGNAQDMALLEEQIDSGIQELLAEYRPEAIDESVEDALGENYKIDISRRLPEFDSGAAIAYAALDIQRPEREIMALVCHSNLPIRRQAIEEMRLVQHPHLITLFEAGITRISTNKLRQPVLIFTKPKGRRLSELLAEGKPFAERALIDQILKPLTDAVAIMHEKGHSHGRIHPGNIFIGDQLVVGEGLSEPEGLTQDYYYEPLERLLADDTGKGTASSKSDAFAIGMLALECLFGLQRYREMDRASYTRLMMEQTPYYLHFGRRDLSDMWSDFFRGTLAENKQDRWTVEHIRQWLGGKRYNLILPPTANEASRGFTFADKDYFSQRMLAYAICTNWATAAKDIKKSRLDRWVEMSARKPEKAELVERILSSYGTDYGNHREKSNNELISRLITALDSFGPMRVKQMALHVDGLGLSFQHYYLKKDQTSLNLLIDLIDWDLPNFWADSCPIEKSQRTNDILWQLQRIRAHLKSPHFGFGIERAIYDLNPELPCQSDWLLEYYLTDVTALLQLLDSLAPAKAMHQSLMDRHLAAFIASKLDLAKEVKFSKLSQLPHLKEQPELIMLSLLAQAQERFGNPKLIGLSCWAAIRLEAMMNHIHSRRLRKRIKLNLRNAAKTGSVHRVLSILIDNDMTADDHHGYTKAKLIYDHNQQKITDLKNDQALQKVSDDLGGRLAVFMAYLVLCITAYFVIDHYL